MKTKLASFLALTTAALLVGCDSKPKSGTVTAPVTPARQTSFGEVTQQLDPGGTVFGYLATDQWLAGLSTKAGKLRDLILDLPDVSATDAENISRVFDFLTKAIAKSGIETLSGVGFSGIQLTPELHRAKLILHHGEGRGQGLLWNMFGTTPHALSGVEFLTTNTALATFGDVDVAALWQAIEKSCLESNVPELQDGIRQWPAEFEKGAKLRWNDLLASLGGEMGLVVTLDEAHRVSLPIGEVGVEIPSPGLLLAVKVKNDVLFDRLAEELKKNESTKFTQDDGVKMYAMPMPVPLPLDLQITLARAGEYLFVATSPTLVQEALAVRAGKLPGLKQSAEYQALQKFLPATGNHFSYVAKRLSVTVLDLQRQVLSLDKNMNQGQMKLIEKFFLSQGPTYGMTVGAHTPTGWQTVSVGNQDASASLVAAPAIGGVAIGAAMVLPALAKAKEKAQSISCVSNMKQVNIALKIWAVDHDDKYPFQVSTNQGGTAELCERDAEGYDRSVCQHFKVMADELNSPRILACPSDKSKQPAADFESLEAWNVSYQLRTGSQVNETNPSEIILYCPVHHHTGLVDGSVQRGTTPGKSRF